MGAKVCKDAGDSHCCFQEVRQGSNPSIINCAEWLHYSAPWGFKHTQSLDNFGCPEKLTKNVNSFPRLITGFAQRLVHGRQYICVYRYIYIYIIDLKMYPAKICKVVQNEETLKLSLVSIRVIPVSWIARHASMGTNTFLLVSVSSSYSVQAKFSSPGRWQIMCYGHFPPFLLNEKTILVHLSHFKISLTPISSFMYFYLVVLWKLPYINMEGIKKSVSKNRNK